MKEIGSVRCALEMAGARREGSVAWAVARAVLYVGDNEPMPVRISIVAHREGLYWRIVHWHGSIARANEEAFGMDLSIDLDNLLAIVQDEPPPSAAVASDGPVVIAFTDMVGSTALMETLGEERWLE